MSADQQRPRFDPPPWEREAFDEFRKKQDEQKAQEELNAALLAVREEKAAEAEAQAAPAADGQDARPIEATAGPPVSEDKTERAEPPEPRISEARIDSMLIQLRGEELPALRNNRPLINTVVGFLGVTGTTIVIQSALLFGDVQASTSASKLLAATMSFMVFATGLGFLGGAFLLYRKYHQ